MANEYIKRSEVVLRLTKQRYAQPDRPKVQAELVDDVLCNAAQHFLKIPSADVAEVRRGEWLPDVYAKDTRTGYEYLTLKCSVCGCGCMSRNNFCHRCGADMRKDGE